METPRNATEASAEAQVVAADVQRVAAFVASDAPMLDLLLARDLRFVHANGTAEDKPTLIQKLLAGQRRYQSLEATERRVRLFGNVALLEGQQCAHLVQVNGAIRTVNTSFLSAWVHEESGQWKMIAWQSTPVQKAP